MYADYALVRRARRERRLARALRERRWRCASARSSSPARSRSSNLYAVRQSVVSLVLPRRIAQHRDRRGGAGPLSAARDASRSRSSIGVAARAAGDDWSTRAARAHRTAVRRDRSVLRRRSRLLRLLAAASRRRCYYWAMLCCSSSIGVVIAPLRADAEPALGRAARCYVSAYVRRHFTMLGGVLLLVLAWSYRLGMYRLLAEGSGPGGAFTSVDHRVTVPATLVLALRHALRRASSCCWAGWSGQMRLAFFAVSAVLLLSLVARTVAPLVARRSVDPDATRRRSVRISATRLSYTRRALRRRDRMRAEIARRRLPHRRRSCAAAIARVGRGDARRVRRARAPRRRRRHRRRLAGVAVGPRRAARGARRGRRERRPRVLGHRPLRRRRPPTSADGPSAIAGRRSLRRRDA